MSAFRGISSHRTTTRQRSIVVPAIRHRSSSATPAITGRGWLLAALLFTAGCPKPADPPAPVAPFQGASIEIAAPAELHLADHWSLQLDEWRASTGADCQLMDTESSGPPPATAALSIFPLRQIPELVAAEWLVRITDDDALDDWNSSLRGLRSGIAQPGGNPGLIPVSCPVLACYYRADLLEAAGRQPPETWDDYQALLADLPNWSNGLSAVEPWRQDFRSTMLLARAASYALHPDNVSILLDLQSGEPLIGGKPFVRALDESVAALKLLDPKSIELGPAECCAMVTSGQAALAIGVPPTVAAAAEMASERSDPNAIVGCVQLPGAAEVYDRATDAWGSPADGRASHVTLVGFGGYAAGVSRNVDDATRKAAWNLWTQLREQAGEDDLPFGTSVCRGRDAAAAARQPAPGFTSSEWRQHVESSTAALQESRVLLDLPLPEAGRFSESLALRITSALEGSTAPTDALNQAAADWKSLIEELGNRRVLAVYRQCHGLSAD